MANKAKKFIEPVEEKEEKKEIVRDRSAYNCSGCKGEGLAGKDRVGNLMICTQCSGTGKV